MGKEGTPGKDRTTRTPDEQKPKREVEVDIAPNAQRQFNQLPLPIQARAREVFIRLKKWPDVSGAKRLKGAYAGSFRIRTGDYRIVFTLVSASRITVWKIGDRKDVYLD